MIMRLMSRAEHNVALGVSLLSECFTAYANSVSTLLHIINTLPLASFYMFAQCVVQLH